MSAEGAVPPVDGAGLEPLSEASGAAVRAMRDRLMTDERVGVALRAAVREDRRVLGWSVVELRSEVQQIRERVRALESGAGPEGSEPPVVREEHPERQLTPEGKATLTRLRHAAWGKGAKKDLYDLEGEWVHACAYVVELEKHPAPDSGGAPNNRDAEWLRSWILRNSGHMSPHDREELLRLAVRLEVRP